MFNQCVGEKIRFEVLIGVLGLEVHAVVTKDIFFFLYNHFSKPGMYLSWRIKACLLYLHTCSVCFLAEGARLCVFFCSLALWRSLLQGVSSG